MSKPCTYVLLIVLFISSAWGCTDARRESIGGSLLEGEGPRSLIDESSRQYHFGAVVAGSGRKLPHRFHLTNETNSTYTIKRIINLKPCCGTVRTDKSLLRPGETTDIEVTLSIGDKFGEVAHDALVLTEPPLPHELLLRTAATAFPPIRVEEISGPDASTPSTKSNAQRTEFRVFAYGSETEPGINLDRLELVSSIPVRWVGPKEEESSAYGLLLSTRRFMATFESTRDLGVLDITVGLRDRSELVLQHVIHREFPSPILAFPRMAVFPTGKSDMRILLRSQDGYAFRVTGFSCTYTGLKASCNSTESSVSHNVVLQGCANIPLRAGDGTLSILTDHPLQATLELKIIVLD